MLGGAALVAAAFWFLGWPYFPGYTPIHANDATGLARFGVNEAPFYIAAAVVEVFLCAYVTARLHERWPRALDELWRDLVNRPDRAFVAFAFLAAALGLGVGLGLLDGHPISEDEKTYLFQSHLLREGHLSAPVPPGSAVFWQPFLVVVSGRWTAQYPWGRAAVLLPGLILGLPNLVPAVEAAVTVYFTGKLAAEYARDARVGILAAALAALSPIVVLTAGTLHNANLSAACVAVSLWALVRLSDHLEEPQRGAAVALALATGIGLHNRMVDQAAVLLGGGVLLVIRHRRELRSLIRALVPPVLLALPLLALHPVINHFAYGHWSTTGYALFNGPRGWKTMGFGVGPFWEPHTWGVAASKSVAALVRVSFYATGSPLGFALLALPCFGVLGRRALAPAIPAGIYAALYFFYAASSIDSTGPVYYLGLMPILVGWVAMGAVGLHDLVRDRAENRRLVPAFLAAQAAAAIVVFWPAQVSYLLDDVRQAWDCEALVEESGIKRGLIFAMSGPPNGDGVPPEATTWHRKPPLPWPPFDAPILYGRAMGFAHDAKAAARFAGDRPVYLERCMVSGARSILRYDPARGTVAALDGTDERQLKRIDTDIEDSDFDIESGTWVDGSDAAPPPWFSIPHVAPKSGLHR